ncbi:MAG: S-methyl-5-thioribose-1-phosphate isomerase [Mariprofundaceae bacterium]|nr:S-methyl-5-thioribose-1-phosphate isomerase [Mariprofundaceae bacterium]
MVQGKTYRAVAWASAKMDAVLWVDQTKLPFHFCVKESKQAEDLACAIEDMEIRGAPSIGAMAAYALALAYAQDQANFEVYWLPRLQRTRPTAVNLFHACDYMLMISKQKQVTAAIMKEAAQHYADDEVQRNQKMGLHLADVLAVGERRIQTHCNAGWLAAVDWGTALSGVYQLSKQGENPSVWVNETRPRMQGGRLTAWELKQQGVRCTIQADAAAAWMMQQGLVDVVVVGADRIASNGDVANKVGTYMLALAAQAHGIPFYVAAPKSTLDEHCLSGSMIEIEHRSKDELLAVTGVDNKGLSVEVSVLTPDVDVNNPAFDITPFACITGIITEQGLWTGLTT